MGNSSHLVCDKSVASSSTLFGWFDEDGQNPCQVLQTLMRRCDKDFTIDLMPASPLNGTDICAPVAGKNLTAPANDFLPCCCNTVAYNLRQACWSCQHGQTDPQNRDRRPTFREYLQCPKSVPKAKQTFKKVGVPQWAYIPIDPDNTWVFMQTRANAQVRFAELGGSNATDSNPGTSPKLALPRGNSTAMFSSAPSFALDSPLSIGLLSASGATLLGVICVLLFWRFRWRLRRARHAQTKAEHSTMHAVDAEIGGETLTVPEPASRRGRNLLGVQTLGLRRASEQAGTERASLLSTPSSTVSGYSRPPPSYRSRDERSGSMFGGAGTPS